MQFSPIWISTTEHLKLFDKVAAQASFLQRLTRDCPYFEGFTYHRSADGKKREPVAFIAAGVMVYDENGIHFESESEDKNNTSRWEKLHQSLSFTLPWDRVKSVLRHEYASPVGRWSSSTWTRIKTSSETDWMKDMLVCLGSSTGSPVSNRRQKMLLEGTRNAIRQHWSEHAETA